MRAWTTRSWSVAVAFAAIAALAYYAAASQDSGLLCLLPALLLACLLLARRYPGERTLIAMHEQRTAHWPHERPCSIGYARLRALRLIVAAHGGQLIARSLAVRPPPALSRATI